MNLLGVRAEEFGDIAPLLMPHFQEFARSARLPVTHFLDRVADRTLQCWVVEDDGEIFACCLTQIDDDLTRTCSVCYCTGREYQKWGWMIDEIGRWACEQGCSVLKVTARPGWGKLLTQHGLKETHRVYERGL